jgi:hypothetical protein
MDADHANTDRTADALRRAITDRPPIRYRHAGDTFRRDPRYIDKTLKIASTSSTAIDIVTCGSALR